MDKQRPFARRSPLLSGLIEPPLPRSIGFLRAPSRAKRLCGSTPAHLLSSLLSRVSLADLEASFFFNAFDFIKFFFSLPFTYDPRLAWLSAVLCPAVSPLRHAPRPPDTVDRSGSGFVSLFTSPLRRAKALLAC